jgi:heme-degrading monooxygenase HmoA
VNQKSKTHEDHYNCMIMECRKMFYAIFMGKVRDYDKWQSTFDEDAPLLKGSGAKSARALRGLDDPKMIIVITEWENLDYAKQFVESDQLGARMQAGGVIGKPDIYYLEEKSILF